VLQVPQARLLVQLAQQVLLAQRVLPEKLVRQVQLQDLLVPPDQLVQLEQVSMVLLDQPAQPAQLGLPARQVQLEMQVR
jgi:hypothetical protein